MSIFLGGFWDPDQIALFRFSTTQIRSLQSDNSDSQRNPGRVLCGSLGRRLRLLGKSTCPVTLFGSWGPCSAHLGRGGGGLCALKP